MEGTTFEAAFLGVAFMVLIALVFALAIAAWHFKRISPQLVGAVIGALVGIVLLEFVPLLT